MSVSQVTGSGASYIYEILDLTTAGSTTTSTTTANSSSSDGDAVSISASGTAASELLELVRQRASLVEARSSLASSTMESGGSTDSIETQLEEYDSQISDIDAQIVEAKAVAVREQADSVLTYANNTYSKTGGASSADALNAAAGLSAKLSTARAAASSMNRLDRQANSLQAEIEADESRGLDTTDKGSELEALEALVSGASFTLSAGLDGINQS